MIEHTIEIAICYNDYFMEVYTVDRREMKSIIPKLLDDESKSFKIDDKTFIKKRPEFSIYSKSGSRLHLYGCYRLKN